jgi:hypothetical protein
VSTVTKLALPVLLIALAALAATAPAAPIPDVLKEPVLFFPVARVTWTYQYHEPGDRVGVELAQFVRSVTEAGGVTHVAPGQFQPHRTLLRWPAVPGDRWVVPAPTPDSPEERYEARGSEPVEVPAGRFDAVRVDTTNVWQDGGTKVDRNWYARNVGLVRWEDSLGRSMVLKRVARRY